MLTLTDVFQAVSMAGAALATAWAILKFFGVNDDEDD